MVGSCVEHRYYMNGRCSVDGRVLWVVEFCDGRYMLLSETKQNKIGKVNIQIQKVQITKKKQ